MKNKTLFVNKLEKAYNLVYSTRTAMDHRTISIRDMYDKINELEKIMSLLTDRIHFEDEN